MSNLFQLNDRLFREMDRLESAEGEALDQEIERARAIAQMAGKVIDNANTAMKAVQMQQQAMGNVAECVAVPRMLLGEGDVDAEVER